MSHVRVLHVLGSMCAYAAGPTNAALNIAAAGMPFDIESAFFTSDWRGGPMDTGTVPVHSFRHYCGRFAYAPTLRKRLRQEIGHADVCHIHGGYQYPTWAAAWEAQRASVPYIVTLHGLLDRFFAHGWRNFRNRILLHCGQQAVLDHATRLHFLSEQELQRSFLGQPRSAVVISNCIGSRAPSARTSAFPRLLSLSRLKDVKNVTCLIRAMPLLPEPLRSNAVLKIAGTGPPDYVAMLHRVAAECDPRGCSIEFLGQVSGEGKNRLLEWASLLCLASHTEGQPYTVIESLAAGVPVVLSPASNMNLVEPAGAGIIVAQNTPEDFADAVAALLLNPERYRAASRAALELVDLRFLAAVIGKQWAELYNSLAGRRSESAHA